VTARTPRFPRNGDQDRGQQDRSEQAQGSRGPVSELLEPGDGIDPDGDREEQQADQRGGGGLGDFGECAPRCQAILNLAAGGGSMIMHGRSDSTLNRHGVRLGSAEIDEALQSVPQILDALIVGVDEPGGGYWMPLFVVLAGEATVDTPLKNTVGKAIRDHASPRHVPDDIIAVPVLPHTRTGKRLEVPVKRLLQGAEPAAVVDPGAVDYPDALAAFTRLGARRPADES
jgi:hypothetical protein